MDSPSAVRVLGYLFLLDQTKKEVFFSSAQRILHTKKDPMMGRHLPPQLLRSPMMILSSKPAAQDRTGPDAPLLPGHQQVAAQDADAGPAAQGGSLRSQ